METPKNVKFCPEEDVVRRISRNVTRRIQGMVWDDLHGAITPLHDIIVAEIECEYKKAWKDYVMPMSF